VTGNDPYCSPPFFFFAQKAETSDSVQLRVIPQAFLGALARILRHLDSLSVGLSDLRSRGAGNWDLEGQHKRSLILLAVEGGLGSGDCIRLLKQRLGTKKRVTV